MSVPQYLEDSILEENRQTLLAKAEADQRYMRGNWSNVANLLSQWGDYAPTLPPGALVALAHGGVSPTDPVGQQVVARGVPATAKPPPRRGPWASSPFGRPPTGLLGPEGPVGPAPGESAVSPGYQEPSDDRSWWQRIGHDVVAAPGVVNRNVVQPINRALDIGASKASGGTIQPETVQAGVAPTDIKGAIRTGMTAMQAGQEAIGISSRIGAKSGMPTVDIGPFHNRGTVVPGSWSDVLNPEQFTLYDQLRGQSTGSGYLPDPNSPAGQTQSAAARNAASIYYNGEQHAFTFGRGLANSVVTPGSKPYSAISGLTDLYISFKGDPASALLNEMSTERGLAKTFTATPEEAYLSTADHLTHLVDTSDKVTRLRAWTNISREDQPDLRLAVIERLKTDEGATLHQLYEGPDALTTHRAALKAIGMNSLGASTYLRQHVNQPFPLRAFNDRKHDDIWNWVANTSDVSTIHNRFGKRLPVGLVSALARTDDPEYAKFLIASELGTTVTRDPVGGPLQEAMRGLSEGVRSTPGFRWIRPLEEMRLLHALPDIVDFSDRNQAFEQAERVLIAVKMPRDRWNPILQKVAGAHDPIAMKQAFWGEGGSLADEVANWISEPGRFHNLIGGYGVPRAHAKQLTKLFWEESAENSKYAADQLGDTMFLPNIVMDGKPVPLVGPVQTNEILNRGIPMPDGRKLMQATTRYRAALHIWDNQGRIGAGLEGFSHFLDFITSDVFKPAVLMAPRVLTRFMADEQLSMASDGMDSWMNHPIKMLGWTIGKEHKVPFSKEGTWVLPHSRQTGMTDLEGNPWLKQIHDYHSEISTALGKGRTTLDNKSPAQIQSSRRVLKQHTFYGKGDEPYLRSWLDNLGNQASNPVSREIARSIRDPQYVMPGVDGPFRIDISGLEPGGLYHGTPRTLDEIKGYASFGDRGVNLYGSGMYLTDNPEVAHSYTAMGRLKAGEQGAVYRVVGHENLRFLDEAAAPTDEIRAAFQRAAGDYADYAEGDTVHDLYENLREGLRDEGFSATEVGEYIDGINANLMDLGYDGVKHAGGVRTQGQLHNAYVVFDPSKLSIAQTATPARSSLMGLDAVKESFKHGGLSSEREMLARANYEWGSRYLDAATPRAAGAPTWDAWADAYIDHEKERLLVQTGGEAHADIVDPELIDAVADGTPFHSPGNVDPAFRRSLEKKVDRFGPERVKGRMVVSETRRKGWDRFVHKMFSLLMDTPTKTLTRSPAFRQEYYRKAQGMMPLLDRESQAKWLRSAAENGVELRPVTQVGELSSEHADQMLKAHALEHVKRILYYPGERVGITDKLRNIVPFADAWRRVIKRWAVLTSEHPQIIRRVQQGVTAARESGFFYPDPAQGGNEVFTMLPGGAMKAFGGADFPMTGDVRGLTLGLGLPGVGPAYSLLAAPLLRDLHAPFQDEVNKYLMPYGAPDTAGGILETFFPGALDKLRASGALSVIGENPSGTQDVTIESLAKYAFARKVSDGTVNLHNVDSIERGQSDARKEARRMYIIMSLSQFTAPAAPHLEHNLKLKDGTVVQRYVLQQDFNRILNDPKQANGDYYKASDIFVSKYGPEYIFGIQGLRQTLVYGIGSGPVAKAFTRSHQSFANKFPDVYGFWAPTAAQTSKGTYEDYLAGTADTTLEEWTRIAEARIGNVAYDRARAQFGPTLTTDQHDYMRMVYDKLVQEFPGFGVPTGIQKLSNVDKINEIQNAIKNKDVPNGRLTDAIKAYIDKRDEMLNEARAQGYKVSSRWTFGSKKGTQGLKAYLYEVGGAIAKQAPEFANIWNDVFKYEVSPDG